MSMKRESARTSVAPVITSRRVFELSGRGGSRNTKAAGRSIKPVYRAEATKTYCQEKPLRTLTTRGARKAPMLIIQ